MAIAHNLILASALLAATLPAQADNLLDHRVGGDTAPFWRRATVVSHAAAAATLGGALWLGSEDRLGRTFWASSEAFLVGNAATEVLKRATGRVRPTETDDPNRWHAGGKSFPSGHATTAAALVTPFILEYADERPAVWLLAALPVYEMVSRVKTRAHWQTDVLAGAAVGAAAGYLAQHKGPFILRALPDGVFVGFRQRF